MKREDIDYENRIIFIRSSDEYRVKFGKDHTIPLSDPLLDLLKNIEQFQRDNEIESDYVFADENGKQLTERKVREAIKEARKFNDFGGHVTIHGLRRRSASQLRRNGKSQAVIKKVLNHSDKKITSRYLGVSHDDEVAALNSLKMEDYFSKG